jgi:aspartate/tyrosine/aromatic aminotransferase
MPKYFKNLPNSSVDDIMTANARWPKFQNAHKNAINTTIGVIIDSETLQPWQPKTVVSTRLETLQLITKNHTFAYQTQVGNVAFLSEAAKMTFGDELYDQSSNELLSYQSLGGTGALFLVKEILVSFIKPSNLGTISLILDSGWPNHPAIFESPFSITSYKHSDPQTGLYNHAAAMQVIDQTAAGHVLLLQTCGYNDDGADRTPEQWDEIFDLAEKKKSVLVLDSAYMGLASGLEADRYPIVQAAKRGILTFVCISFSKNMGLYNERLGALFIVNAPKRIGSDQTHNLHQLITRIVRRTISSQPFLVAESATKVLQQEAFYEELELARTRIDANRQIIAAALIKKIPHVGRGKGLFTKLLSNGFSAEQLNALEEQAILMLPSSRINLGGMRFDQAKIVGNAIATELRS